MVGSANIPTLVGGVDVDISFVEGKDAIMMVVPNKQLDVHCQCRSQSTCGIDQPQFGAAVTRSSLVT